MGAGVLIEGKLTVATSGKHVVLLGARLFREGSLAPDPVIPRWVRRIGALEHWSLVSRELEGPGDLETSHSSIGRREGKSGASFLL